MGYMTVTMFLNDAEQNVKENPTEVATNVHEAMLGVGMSRDYSRDFAIGNHVNAMKAVSPQHADVPQLVLAYQNDLVRYGFASDLNETRHLEYRKRLLEVARRVLDSEEECIRELEKKANQ